VHPIEYIKKVLIGIPIVIFQRKIFFIHKKCSKAPVTISQMLKKSPLKSPKITSKRLNKQAIPTKSPNHQNHPILK
jgi:hypothetical protein